MNRCPANLRIAAVIVLAAVIWTTPLVILTGCGKKAMPEPPSGRRTPRVTDLAYHIREGVIKLSWTIPATSDKARSPVSGFFIYRAQQSGIEADCPGCPVHFELIGDVLVRRGGSGQSEATVIFTQEIDPGFRYIYKVRAYDDDGMTGRDSNVVDFTY